VGGLRWLARALALLAAAALLWRTRGFFAYAAAAVGYPFELGYGEGQVLLHTQRLMACESMYGPVTPLHAVVCNYPPVYHAVVALLALAGVDTLTLGRIVSAAATVLAAFVLAGLAWRLGSRGADRVDRAIGAGLAALLFLTNGYALAFGVLMRVDMLATLLAFTGVLAFLRCADRGTRPHWAAMLFVLAVYTRQSTVAAPLACVLAALAVRPALAWRLTAESAALGLVAFAALQAFTAGQFWVHTVSGTGHAFYWHRSGLFILEMLTTYSIPIVIAAVEARRLLMVPAGRWRSSDRGLDWDAAVIGVYLVTAFLITFTSGKVGSDVNYLIEFMGVTYVICGAVVARALSAAARLTSTGTPLWRGPALAALLLPLLLLWQATAGYRDVGAEAPVPGPVIRAEKERVRNLIAGTAGPVLCEDLTLLLRSGKPVDFAPFEMTHLAARGRWDQGPFLHRIEQREFALIVLEFDLFATPRGGAELFSYERFSPEMIAAMRRSYRLHRWRGGYWIYVPEETGDAADRSRPPPEARITIDEGG
jgi:hypothetical protein